MLYRLLKIVAYVMIAFSLIFIFAALISIFNTWAWPKNRVLAMVSIIIMIISFKGMHEYIRSKFHFYAWALVAFLMAFVEISAVLSILHSMFTDRVVITYLDSALNMILFVFVLLFNMIAGVWVVDRINEVGK